MSKGKNTLEGLRQAGLQALARELGPVGMVRFLQQFEAGKGDYGRERKQRLGRPRVRTLARKVSSIKRKGA